MNNINEIKLEKNDLEKDIECVACYTKDLSKLIRLLCCKGKQNICIDCIKQCNKCPTCRKDIKNINGNIKIEFIEKETIIEKEKIVEKIIEKVNVIDRIFYKMIENIDQNNIKQCYYLYQRFVKYNNCQMLLNNFSIILSTQSNNSNLLPLNLIKFINIFGDNFNFNFPIFPMTLSDNINDIKFNQYISFKNILKENKLDNKIVSNFMIEIEFQNNIGISIDQIQIYFLVNQLI